MPKNKKKSKARRAVPPWGRSEKHVQNDMGLRNSSSDVPLGNTDPTMVRGVIYGGMPNQSRTARGRLRALKGKGG